MKKLKKLNLILLTSILTGGLGLTGCTSTNHISLNEASPLEIISSEAEKALIAQKNLANTRANKLRELQVKSSNIDHDLIEIDYIGEPIPLIKSIAINYGYRMIESGQAKNLPIINFNKQKKTATEYLRDIATSVDGIDITLDKQQKTILINYK